MDGMIESWAAEVRFERHGPLRRLLRAAVLNPVANYTPAGAMRALLRFGKSELAAANWQDPGGWRSMVISYEGRPRQIADKLLVGGGAVSMALRNRKRLAGRLLAGLIDQCENPPAHVVGLGAGPALILLDAMARAESESRATLIDISSDAFDYGRQAAANAGVAERVLYLKGDVRNIRELLSEPPDILKMLGICEYLTDEQLVDILQAVAPAMPPGSSLVTNSTSPAHGTDRFLRRVFGLHMIYRTPEQLRELLGRGGFGDFTSIREPLGVYHVLVGRRLA